MNYEQTIRTKLSKEFHAKKFETMPMNAIEIIKRCNGSDITDNDFFAYKIYNEQMPFIWGCTIQIAKKDPTKVTHKPDKPIKKTVNAIIVSYESGKYNIKIKVGSMELPHYADCIETKSQGIQSCIRDDLRKAVICSLHKAVELCMKSKITIILTAVFISEQYSNEDLVAYSMDVDQSFLESNLLNGPDIDFSPGKLSVIATNSSQIKDLVDFMNIFS